MGERALGVSMINEKLVLRVDEAAELLGVHINTLRKYLAQGVIPHRRLGRRILIPRGELLRWLEENPHGHGDHGKRR